MKKSKKGRNKKCIAVCVKSQPTLYTVQKVCLCSFSWPNGAIFNLPLSQIALLDTTAYPLLFLASNWIIISSLRFACCVCVCASRNNGRTHPPTHPPTHKPLFLPGVLAFFSNFQTGPRHAMPSPPSFVLAQVAVTDGT